MLEKVGLYQVVWAYYAVIGHVMCLWAAHPMQDHFRPHDFGLLQESMKVLKHLAEEGKQATKKGNTESNVTMITSLLPRM